MSEDIIRHYLRYVLVRCSWYTNIKTEVEQVAVDALLASCILASEQNGWGEIGYLVDCMAGRIAFDIVASSTHAHSNRFPCNAEILIADRKMLQLAKGINGLELSGRQVVVFHHIEMMSTKQIADMFGKTIRDIRQELEKCEKGIVKDFAEVYGKSVSADDVPQLLYEFEESLDPDLIRRISEAVHSWLAKGEEGIAKVAKYLDFWRLRRE